MSMRLRRMRAERRRIYEFEIKGVVVLCVPLSVKKLLLIHMILGVRAWN